MNDAETPPTTTSDDEKACAFEAMALVVGTRVQLIPGGPIGKTHYYAPVIGYVTGRYLIVQTPVADGMPVSLHEGEMVTIQVFSGLEVLSFDTTILNVFGNPFFYLHLDHPNAVRRTSLRHSIRVKVAIPVSVKPAHQGDAIAALIDDLSATGARVESAESLGAEGDSIGLTFSFLVQPGHVDVRVDAKATIRSVKRRASPGAANGCVVGVEFEALAPDQRVMLQSLIYETLLADRKSMA